MNPPIFLTEESQVAPHTCSHQLIVPSSYASISQIVHHIRIYIYILHDYTSIHTYIYIYTYLYIYIYNYNYIHIHYAYTSRTSPLHPHSLPPKTTSASLTSVPLSFQRRHHVMPRFFQIPGHWRLGAPGCGGHSLVGVPTLRWPQGRFRAREITDLNGPFSSMPCLISRGYKD